MKTLENKLNEMIPSHWQSMDVIAFEMQNDGEGWSVNTPFRIASGVGREEAICALRHRWEVVKANYAPKARVCDISDIACDETICNLEVACMAFADVRVCQN